MPEGSRVVRALGGLFFVLAGLAYYFAVTVEYSIALLLVAGGAAVFLLALLGHRASPGDTAVFVLGLLVLGAFVTPGLVTGGAGGERLTYTVPRSGISAEQVDLVATTDVGSVSVSYTDDSAVGYQVNFTSSAFPFSIFSGVAPYASLTNESVGDVLLVNASARAYDVSVSVWSGYPLNITASTGTGSVDVKASAGQRLGDVSLESGTGSVSADLTSLSVGAISLQTGTGSLSLSSSHLAPNAQRLPIGLQTGTGSITLDVDLAGGTAATIGATAALGGVSHNLVGFTVDPQTTKSNLIASAGDMASAQGSFEVKASAGTGSVTVDARLVG